MSSEQFAEATSLLCRAYIDTTGDVSKVSLKNFNSLDGLDITTKLIVTEFRREEWQEDWNNLFFDNFLQDFCNHPYKLREGREGLLKDNLLKALCSATKLPQDEMVNAYRLFQLCKMETTLDTQDFICRMLKNL